MSTDSLGIYPGSFNPFHKGHEDIVRKALRVFDAVIIAQGKNPSKPYNHEDFRSWKAEVEAIFPVERVYVQNFDGFLHEFVKTITVWTEGSVAIVRGLRSGYDLEAEINQQYWYEDLGLTVPIVYFVCDRRLSHISSSAIRAVNSMKG